MAEIITVKCPKCGWEQKVVKGKLIAVYCPKCKTRIPLRPEKPEEESVKEAKIEQEEIQE